MTSAHQRLTAANPAIRQAKLWLKVDFKLFRNQRLAQIAREFRLRLLDLAQMRRVANNLTATTRLGAVKRLIGALNQGLAGIGKPLWQAGPD